ncbi:hypothetical protein GobsT_23370 [Gemmata obscuriglobus]|uniref:HEAT repeat domain-containing protein n=1 Tax=Gemmata obscuriglobus TaxID=114 RepID=A0A2Z3HDI9_9BACT|nr:hypothetical protein [Gemmata obscuriglobus]AWM39350.1 hypothetical protein C1280_21755 [Gemmata obscuriglobus]QEG27580.1 hypothetical protein GobsT_23370 [Gemmata obscuriglobus]VTS04681.1 unnamed protein product [Gemmata obscuriglobus UQM 2246]
MTLARCISWTLLAGAGFALFAGPAAGQAPPLPRKDNSAVEKVVGYRDALKGIPADGLNEAKENFAKFAKYYADVVAHPSVYKTPQEFKLDAPGTLHLSIDGPNGILQDIARFTLEAAPGASRPTPEHAVYIRELGAALDAAFKELIEKHPDPIVRVNAARVLSVVCRSGSSAHYPTLTGLIANANTRTEIKYYALQGAANLLAAYDADWIKTRNHVAQTEEPNLVGELVKVLDAGVNDPARLVAGLPENKVTKATEEQLAVVALVRRQGIKALAQFRYVSSTDGSGQVIYPVHTLARIALSDPALVPAPGPADAAEAVIGICNMAPVQVKGVRVTPLKYNADAALEAVTAGLITFASPRAADAFDRRLPWRTYSLRIAIAVRNWRPLFDPDFDVTKPSAFDAGRVPAAVEDFYKDTIPKVLAPMDRVDNSGKPDIGAKVDIEGLRSRLTALRANPKRSTTLLAGVAATSIEFGPAPK